jgi:hypothetical protein
MTFFLVGDIRSFLLPSPPWIESFRIFFIDWVKSLRLFYIEVTVSVNPDT